MAEVQQNLPRQEAMTSLVMEKSLTYPEVKLRQKNPADASETQRKRRSKHRLSNRRSTGFVYEEEVKAALEMGAEGKKAENGECLNRM